jgi:hypothetical protein
MAESDGAETIALYLHAYRQHMCTNICIHMHRSGSPTFITWQKLGGKWQSKKEQEKE